jgi:hypothetical protein
VEAGSTPMCHQQTPWSIVISSSSAGPLHAHSRTITGCNCVPVRRRRAGQLFLGSTNWSLGGMMINPTISGWMDPRADVPPADALVHHGDLQLVLGPPPCHARPPEVAASGRRCCCPYRSPGNPGLSMSRDGAT